MWIVKLNEQYFVAITPSGQSDVFTKGINKAWKFDDITNAGKLRNRLGYEDAVIIYLE